MQAALRCFSPSARSPATPIGHHCSPYSRHAHDTRCRPKQPKIAPQDDTMDQPVILPAVTPEGTPKTQLPDALTDPTVNKNTFKNPGGPFQNMHLKQPGIFSESTLAISFAIELGLQQVTETPPEVTGLPANTATSVMLKVPGAQRTISTETQKTSNPQQKCRRLSPIPAHDYESDRYDQRDCRSPNVPAEHSGEPHTAVRPPASNEAQDLVLRLSSMQPALFPGTAPAPRDPQVPNPQQGKGIPATRDPRASDTTNPHRGRGAPPSRHPQAPMVSNQQRGKGKSGKSGGKGRGLKGGKDSEVTVPIKLTVKIHVEEPRKEE